MARSPSFEMVNQGVVRPGRRINTSLYCGSQSGFQEGFLWGKAQISVYHKDAADRILDFGTTGQYQRLECSADTGKK